MDWQWWVAWLERAGGVAAVMEGAAIWWLLRELGKRDDKIDAANSKVESLAERFIALATDIRTFMFNERKP